MFDPLLPIHVLAGSISLFAGTLALFASKGKRLHRLSGTVFFGSMVAMSLTGAYIAAMNGTTISVIAGALTFYLVVTSWRAARHRSFRADAVSIILSIAAVSVGTAGTYFGLRALNSPSGTIGGFPAPPYFVFAGVAFLAGSLDVKVMMVRELSGPKRLARHLWRMCFALFIAAASLFLGQPQVFPEAVRHPAILGLPVLATLAVMIFWLTKVLAGRRSKGAARPS